MAEEITVELFPPNPPGYAVQNTPQGPLPVPLAAIPYRGVRDVEVDDLGKVITFTERTGDRIESNLPFVVRRAVKSEGDA